MTRGLANKTGKLPEAFRRHPNLWQVLCCAPCPGPVDLAWTSALHPFCLRPVSEPGLLKGSSWQFFDHLLQVPAEPWFFIVCTLSLEPLPCMGLAFGREAAKRIFSTEVQSGGLSNST